MSPLELARKTYATLHCSATCTGGEISEKSEKRVWDQSQADAILAEVYRRCDQALTSGEANTQARRNVVKVCCEVAAQHHKGRDALLWDELESLQALFARWKEAPTDDAPWEGFD
jgi:hypothetical protein